MPKLNVIAVPKNIHTVSLVDSGSASICSAAITLGIAKSTLHDNLPNFRKATQDFVEWHSSSEERLIRHTLAISMEGKSSARDAATVLSRIEDRHIDRQKVLEILATASKITDSENLKRIPLRLVGNSDESLNLPMTGVSCAALDEIFQKHLFYLLSSR